MHQQKEKPYILGTDRAELHRLGLQHQVWASEARRGWEIAGFRPGQTILDLGCGPGYCTTELAYLVGGSGKVIGVDLSPSFIAFLQKLVGLQSLDIDLRACSFDEMELPDNSLDGVYCRWGLAWVANPDEVLAKLKKALKPGGRMVIQEYFDWSTFQTEPAMPGLERTIAACLRSMKEQPGDIDVGRKIPAIAKGLGLEIVSLRPMSKMARPSDLNWIWPDSYLRIYPKKLVATGYLTEAAEAAAIADLDALRAMPEAVIFCPAMVEVVLGK